jgi:hypothetical protein
MPFQKNHKLGTQKILDKSRDKDPICFRGYEGQKAKLRSIPNWQERMRQFIDEITPDQNDYV